jgi:tetratricopeptide (TPR) repeat protein
MGAAAGLLMWSAAVLPLPGGVTVTSQPLPEPVLAEPLVQWTGALSDPLQVAALAAAYRDQGMELLKRKELDGALAALRLSHALRPDDPATLDGLATAHDQRNEPLLAEPFFLRAVELDPKRSGVRVRLGEFLLNRLGGPGRDRRSDLDAALTHLDAAGQLGERDPWLLCLLARVQAERGACSGAATALDACLKPPQRKVPKRKSSELWVALADCRLTEGDLDAAELALDRTDAGELVTLRREAIGNARRRSQVAPAPEREVGLQRARGLSHQALELIDQRGAAGKLVPDAVARTEAWTGQAMRLAPDLAVVQLARGTVLALQRHEAAEIHLVRALALGLPDDRLAARAGAELGRLYLAGSRAAEAAAVLEDAVRREPTDLDLRWDLVDAHRRAGQLRPALQHLDRWLKHVETAPPERRSDALALRRALHDAVATLAPDPRTQPLPPGAESAVREARKLAGADRFREAADVLRRHLRETGTKLGTNAAPLWNELALYADAMADPDAALHARRESLRARPDQPEVHLTVARALLRKKRATDALPHLDAAQRMGSADARVLRTALDLQRTPPGTLHVRDLLRIDDLTAVRAELVTYLATAGRREVATARVLLAEVDARLFAVRAWLAAGLALLLALLVALAWWRWGGRDLLRFLVDHPAAGAEVARLLAAVRHEVLKHNTVVLEGLAEALERNAPEAAEQADHVRQTLLGGGSEPAVADRLAGYVAELRLVARAHGVRLNVRRDRALRALHEGFAVLRSARRSLQRVGTLGPRGRLRLVQDLRRAARLLNAEAWSAVAELLDALRRFPVDVAQLRHVFARTRSEPDLSAIPVAPLDVDARTELPVWVQVPRAAFDDVIGNLLRNAIQAGATGAARDRPVQLGVWLDVHASPVTGLESLEIGVRDRVPVPLTQEQLRAAPGDRGLGLCRELVQRHDGMIEVRADTDPWCKAVVVRFPRAEDAE